MIGSDGQVAYNVGQMRERSFPKSLGSSAANSGAQVQEASFNGIIPESSEKSNRQNSLKTGDLLSPDYGKKSDTSSTAGGSPSPQGEGSGESYIKETELDSCFDDVQEWAKVIFF